MKKTIIIRMKRGQRINQNPAANPATFLEFYTIESMRHAAHITLNSKMFRVGDEVTPVEADALCDIIRYDITITQ